MPLAVSEITSGTGFSRQADPKGLVTDTQTRAFKILLATPDEFVNIQSACGVFVGSTHPVNNWLYCDSFDARFDGESRMVIIATFSYKSFEWPEDNQKDPPGQRLANWSTSTSLIESPVYTWRKRTGAEAWESGATPAENSAGDIYDAISKLTGMVNITITQETIGSPPLAHNAYCGYINKEEIKLGPLTMKKHTVMFRGVTIQPFQETFNEAQYRGWRSSYEFAYKPNRTEIYVGSSMQSVDLGWDIAVPQTGFNVKAFAPPGGNDDDPYGQPLKHGGGKIVPAWALPVGISPGNKVRAMVRVFDYEDGGTSQAPSASPISLNDNGRPRSPDANPKVLVYGYQVQPDIDFTSQFSLRLRN